jgi:hypothetical protein
MSQAVSSSGNATVHAFVPGTRATGCRGGLCPLVLCLVLSRVMRGAAVRRGLMFQASGHLNPELGLFSCNISHAPLNRDGE